MAGLTAVENVTVPLELDGCGSARLAVKAALERVELGRAG